MKTVKYLFVATLLCFSSAMMAQSSDLVIFSEDADRFFVMVNGIHQNTEAQSNVKIKGLQAEAAYKVKVIFQDNTLPGLEKAIYTEANMEFSFNIKRNKKGVLKMTPFGYTAINPNATTPNQYVVQYGNNQNNTVVTDNSNTTTTTTTTTNTNTVETNDVNVVVDENATIETTVIENHDGTTHTNATINTTITETGNNGTVNTTVGDGTTTVSMDVTVSENGVNVNVSENGNPVDGNPVDANFSTNVQINDPNNNSTYTETTTITTTTTVNGQVTEHNHHTNTNTDTNNNANFSANNAPCYAMSATDYASAKSSIQNKDFEDSRIKIAKQIVDNNCVDAEQIKGIAELFDFEASRLDFAKYAYKKCSDPQNYYKINDVFDFESSIEELDAFIK